MNDCSAGSPNRSSTARVTTIVAVWVATSSALGSPPGSRVPDTSVSTIRTPAVTPQPRRRRTAIGMVRMKNRPIPAYRASRDCSRGSGSRRASVSAVTGDG